MPPKQVRSTARGCCGGSAQSIDDLSSGGTPPAHCTPVCTYTVTIFLFASRTIDAISRCGDTELLAMGGFLLEDLVVDSTPLKNRLIGIIGCNSDIVVVVTQQPVSFFFDISITVACQDRCCLDEITGADGEGGFYSTNFVELDCQPF